MNLIFEKSTFLSLCLSSACSKIHIKEMCRFFVEHNSVHFDGQHNIFSLYE